MNVSMCQIYHFTISLKLTAIITNNYCENMWI